jgi:hypothetical protein
MLIESNRRDCLGRLIGNSNAGRHRLNIRPWTTPWFGVAGQAGRRRPARL